MTFNHHIQNQNKQTLLLWCINDYPIQNLENCMEFYFLIGLLRCLSYYNLPLILLSIYTCHPNLPNILFITHELWLSLSLPMFSLRKILFLECVIWIHNSFINICVQNMTVELNFISLGFNHEITAYSK